jgi:methyltransferase
VVAALAIQRLSELVVSARHLRLLRERGAVEFRAPHFAGIVALHALFPLALIAEVALAGARPGRLWPALLLPLAAAQALRVASMAALGDLWHVRVWVVPGTAPVREGIYRWLAHPNYAGVALELASLALIFGAWRTALVASAVNGALLARRIALERRALRWAQGAAPARPTRMQTG